VVQSGGTATASSGGTVKLATVYAGGFVTVSAGGTTSSTTVSAGGAEFLTAAGTAASTTVDSGGVEFVFSTGKASGTILSSGGSLIILPGATQTATQLSGGEVVSTGVVVYQTNSGVRLYTGVASGGVVGSGIVEYVLSGGTAANTTVTNGGTEAVYVGGTTISTTVSYGAAENVDAGGQAWNTTVDGGTEYVFAGGTTTASMLNSGSTEVVLSGGTAYGTTVDSGGTIDVTYLSYTTGGSARVNTSGLLTVSVGGYTYSQQLEGDYTDEHFRLAQDASSGTLVTAIPGAQCYRSGTRILTNRGEVAVEALRIGDLVHTVLGEDTAPIIWVGRREVDCASHPQPRKVWPVRVSAGVFGPGRPHTDLFLSPDHAVYVVDVLIPVRHLINGSTIMQVPVERVTYYHLELAEHDVVLAEGLSAESFLDMRDGSQYASRPGPVRLYPDFSAGMWEAFGCAPLIVTGPKLMAARALVAHFATDQAAA
jgi:autotransporter passenger strand-loop-strand repeat protein